MLSLPLEVCKDSFSLRHRPHISSHEIQTWIPHATFHATSLPSSLTQIWSADIEKVIMIVNSNNYKQMFKQVKPNSRRMLLAKYCSFIKFSGNFLSIYSLFYEKLSKTFVHKLLIFYLIFVEKAS